ncbi:MAG: hypothetical protein P4N41_24410 [Negativicutes bacterium]|nr:hypothetical protein [Negativicutes bacterium]MDR3592814.1 hypothetical protein [Negativicutes bacterium]
MRNGKYLVALFVIMTVIFSPLAAAAADGAATAGKRTMRYVVQVSDDFWDTATYVKSGVVYKPQRLTIAVMAVNGQGRTMVPYYSGALAAGQSSVTIDAVFPTGQAVVTLVKFESPGDTWAAISSDIHTNRGQTVTYSFKAPPPLDVQVTTTPMPRQLPPTLEQPSQPPAHNLTPITDPKAKAEPPGELPVTVAIELESPEYFWLAPMRWNSGPVMRPGALLTRVWFAGQVQSDFSPGLVNPLRRSDFDPGWSQAKQTQLLPTGTPVSVELVLMENYYRGSVLQRVEFTNNGAPLVFKITTTTPPPDWGITWKIGETLFAE